MHNACDICINLLHLLLGGQNRQQCRRCFGSNRCALCMGPSLWHYLCSLSRVVQ